MTARMINCPSNAKLARTSAAITRSTPVTTLAGSNPPRDFSRRSDESGNIQAGEEFLHTAVHILQEALESRGVQGIQLCSDYIFLHAG